MLQETTQSDPVGGATLDVKQFQAIKKKLYDVAGITLADHKRQMVENRIARRIKQLSLSSYSAYVSYLESEHHADEVVHLVNALTTNVTHFFREEHHFDHLREKIGVLLSEVAPKIRIWSAGCSVGAEPYSAGIAAYDMMKQLKVRADLRILATDIDTMALARGRKGEYPKRIIKGLNSVLLKTHFSEIESGDEKGYRVKEHLRQLVAFNYLNFNTRCWPMSGPFDFIFCRNALIYFDRPKQQEYVEKMLRVLKPGGFLYLGHSEHAVMEGRGYKICGQTIYQKPL